MQTLSQKIAHWLPDLRRYAHALSGTQERGDLRMRLFLEVLLENKDGLVSTNDIRRELYRYFHTVLHRVDLELDLDGAVDGLAPDRRLRDAVAALPARGREVLLLTSMCGFDTAEVAEILGIKERGVAHQLDEARAQIKRRMSARILIIEDESRAAEKIEHALEEMGHTVVGVAHSEREATRLAHEKHPELVVADMHGQNGNEATLSSAMDAPVVFLRAPHGRRAQQHASRRAGSRRQTPQRVSAQDVRSAVNQALPVASVIALNTRR